MNVKDLNILEYYPSGITQEEADSMFNKEWARDYKYRLALLEQGMESAAGFGTNLGEVSVYFSELPKILESFEIKSFLDAGCSDYFIMKNIDFSQIQYIGLDFVEEQIAWNKQRYPNVEFRTANILSDALPESDLVFCRDVLIHFSNYNIFRFLNNCLKSNCKYVLLGTYFDLLENKEMGGIHGWRFMNLEKGPFNFPSPIYRIVEPGRHPTDSGSDSSKGMGLWKLSDLKEIINQNI
jgi:SAM-dependent methyltransferase